jgi:hypothetical protein
MTRARLIASIALVLVTTTACGPLKVSSKAVDEFRSATRLAVPETIEVSDDQVVRLADRAGVGDDVIRNVAPDLEAQSTWKSSTTKLRELFDSVPPEVRSETMSIACEVVMSEDQTTDAIAQALYNAFGPVDERQLEQIISSFLDYFNDMNAALEAGDEAAAAVVLTCFIAEQAS